MECVEFRYGIVFGTGRERTLEGLTGLLIEKNPFQPQYLCSLSD